MGYFDTQFKKGIAATVISGVAVVVVVSVFSSFYNAYESPKAKRQNTATERELHKLNSKDSAKTIQFILMRNDVNNISKKVDDGFERIEKQLKEINRNTK